jgi:hypothetical protein
MRAIEAGEAFIQSAGNERESGALPFEAWDHLGALRQTQELAVLAAFFCLLFFAAAKKSRCRPAQGQRLKHEGKTRMPAQELQQEQKGRRQRTGNKTPKEASRLRLTITSSAH